MTEKKPNPYDRVAYIGHAFAQTHPDRLATLARLFGLNPAPVDRCRVLELGCGDGGNLIPMAYCLQGGRFVGIDLAAAPVAAGSSLIAELELDNIELHCRDIMAVDPSLGQFDYIIAHGVYSWVQREVRERMMWLCGELLAPHGVAYISYNTYPGCYLRQMAREMMLFHVRDVGDPAQRIEQGLAVLRLILSKFSEPALAKSDLYSIVVTEQLERMSEYRHREQIFHDELAQVNQPVYFHEFMAGAEAHGLQYLSEANFFETQDFIYPPPVRDFLRQFGPNEVIAKEQYLDFLKGRGFRQTLLCRKDVGLNRNPAPHLIKPFFIESSAKPVGDQPDLSPGAVEAFRGPRGARLQTDHPLAKAALIELGQASPRALGWEELVTKANARLNGSLKADEAVEGEQEKSLAEILMAAYGAGLVELQTQRRRFVTEVDERPVASRLVRAQAKRGGTVSNLLHKIVEFEDEPGRFMLQLLDGGRDRASLCNEMVAFMTRRGPVRRPDGVEIADEREIREVIAEAVEANLRKFAQMALLH